MKIVRGRYPPISSSYSKDLRQCVDVCRDAPFQPSLPAIRRAAARLTCGGRPHPHLQDLLKMSPAQRPAAMDLAGVSKLVLEVDPAGPFTLDRADWLRPMLVR